jgi:DNA-binding transcriptional MerR regulator
MGSNQLISAKEAADTLGISVASINYHVRQGMLQPVYSKDRKLNDRRYRKDEVEALAEARERGLSLPRVASMAARSYATSRALEHRIDRLEQVLGVGLNPLPLDEESVLALYAEACDKEHPAHKLSDLARWTRTLFAMGEEFFELLEVYTGDEDGWVTFMDFIRATLDAAPAEASPEVVQIYEMLRSARNHLRNVSYVYARNKYGAKKANRAFHGDEHDQLIKIVEGMRKKR